MSKGKLFILSGPSGSGKDTVMQKVFEKLPEHLTYPNVTPKLIAEASKWWEYRKGSQ